MNKNGVMVTADPEHAVNFYDDEDELPGVWLQMDCGHWHGAAEQSIAAIDVREGRRTFTFRCSLCGDHAESTCTGVIWHPRMAVHHITGL